MVSPPIANSQYENAFTRGNAMSAAPIWSGTMKFAKPIVTGITNRKIIVMAWMVNSWLYRWKLNRWLVGLYSWVRIISASRPPTRKKKNAVEMYRMPIRLWSVVVSHDTTGFRLGASAGPTPSRVTSVTAIDAPI